jgi:glycosyltransferase involved in cell wall biosynthesis
MKSSPRLTVVIPCYNEEENIRRGALDQVGSFLEKKKYPAEVLIVDDGSTDKSVDLLKTYIKNKPLFRLITNPHQGKAQTVTTGIAQAHGKYILFADLDQATPIEEFDKMEPYFSEYDIVIGSRKNRREGAPFSRILMAKGFMFLRSLMLQLSLDDTQCGFKAFKKEAAHRIFPKLLLYKHGNKTSGSRVTAGFDVELLFIAQKLGYRIKEVPVKWRYVETRRVNPIRDSIEGFLDLVRIKLNELNGTYE